MLRCVMRVGWAVRIIFLLILRDEGGVCLLVMVRKESGREKGRESGGERGRREG